MKAHPRSILRLYLFVLTLAASSLGAENRRDLAYGAHPAQTLDLYLPDAKPGFATLVFVHGGSLMGGDKADDDYKNVCTQFPKSGLGCASINYRLAKDADWPAQAEDVAAAVAFVRKTVAAAGGDPKKIFLMGHSSGAMLAAVVASDERFLAAHNLKPTDLAGAIPMGSIMWDEEFEAIAANTPKERIAQAFKYDTHYKMFGTPEKYIAAWPMKHVNAAMPPFLFLIAEAEQEQPPILRHAQTFCAAATKLGVECSWKVLKDRKHMTAMTKMAEKGDTAFLLVMEFMQGHSAK
ncbi:MAG: alpha/beta hydrolase [Acidobacteriales bacterium]|nr:alpha/beta hydrolase [Terriglobales bacterium]